MNAETIIKTLNQTEEKIFSLYGPVADARAEYESAESATKMLLAICQPDKGTVAERQKQAYQNENVQLSLERTEKARFAYYRKKAELEKYIKRWETYRTMVSYEKQKVNLI